MILLRYPRKTELGTARNAQNSSTQVGPHRPIALGPDVGIRDHMHMVGPDVRLLQVPAPVSAMPPDGRQHHLPGRFVGHAYLMAGLDAVAGSGPQLLRITSV